MIRFFFNSPIFSNVKCMYYKNDKYRTVKKNSYHRCSLVPFLFTPPLPSNPILSKRECFLYLVLHVFYILYYIGFARVTSLFTFCFLYCRPFGYICVYGCCVAGCKNRHSKGTK